MLWSGSATGLDGPIFFIVNGKEVKKYFTPQNIVETYSFPEVLSAFMNDSGYMDDETWTKVVAVLVPVIQKMPFNL